MADITAATVMKLRKMSGQGMMDCKAALKESGGDLDEAMATLRKKGLATLAKRAGRDTTEGKVVSKVSDDGKTAAMCSLCCETDFAAKSDDFGVAAGQLADYAMACTADEGAEALLATEVDGKSRKIRISVECIESVETKSFKKSWMERAVIHTKRW